jgi:cellulose synthase/poly-beta-1,6-N-acetylglucosamine synthase-like glycosyltransferase
MIPLEPGLRREEIAWLNGCCLLVRREAFDMVHGFDTDYFLYQAEADLCLRARRAGYRLGHIDNSVVYHEQRESQRDLSEYDYSRRIFEGNAVFGTSTSPHSTSFACFAFSTGCVGSCSRWERRGNSSRCLSISSLTRDSKHGATSVPSCSAAHVGRARAVPSISLRIGMRQVRLVLEWVRRGHFPLDDY